MKKIDRSSRWFLPLLVLLVMAGAVSTDIYLPSLPDLVGIFHASESRVQLTLSVFFAGFAVAQLIMGPLSDRFGRRPALLAGIVLYMAASVVCLVAPTIEILIAGRFFQALGACAGPVLSRAIVRDAFPRDQAAKAFATMALIFAVTPALAPILGGNLHALFGWRANFVVMLLFALTQLVAVLLFLGETNTHVSRNALRPARILVNYWLLSRERIFIGNTLLVMLVFASLFSLVSGQPFMIIGIIGMKPEYFGFCMAFEVIGFLVGSLVVARLTHRFGSERIIAFGVGVGFVAALVMTALAWAGVQSVPAIVGPGAFIFLANALVMPSATALAIAKHPRIAGAASALLGFLQMAGASFAGWLGQALHNGTTRPVPSVILALLFLALAVLWFARERKPKGLNPPAS